MGNPSDMAIDHSLTYRGGRLRNLPHRMRLRTIEREFRHLQQASADLCRSEVQQRLLAAPAVVASLIRPRRAIELDGSEEQVQIGSLRHPPLGCPARSARRTAVRRRGDLVTCFETLEHVGRLEAAVGNLPRPSARAALRSSGPVEIGPAASPSSRPRWRPATTSPSCNLLGCSAVMLVACLCFPHDQFRK